MDWKTCGLAFTITNKIQRFMEILATLPPFPGFDRYGRPAVPAFFVSTIRVSSVFICFFQKDWDAVVWRWVWVGHICGRGTSVAPSCTHGRPPQSITAPLSSESRPGHLRSTGAAATTDRSRWPRSGDVISILASLSSEELVGEETAHHPLPSALDGSIWGLLGSSGSLDPWGKLFGRPWL